MRCMFYFVLILLCGCCSSKELSEEDLNKYILDVDNGLIQSQSYEGFDVSVTYRPSDFIAKQQMISSEEREYDSLRAAFSKYYYFILDISKNGKDLETFFVQQNKDLAERISFLNSDFAEKISIIYSGKSEPLIDYAYVRTFGSGTSQFLLAFNRQNNDMQVVLDGTELGFGQTHFNFQNKKISQIPKLKLL